MKKDMDFDSPRATVSRQGRTVYFFDEVNEISVMEAIKHIMKLQNECKTKPITIVINSPGGICADGLALYDCIRSCSNPIITIGMGMVASMGFIIYLAGDERIASPNVVFLNHQPWGGAEGKASDIEIEAHQINKTKEKMIKIVSDRTGMTIATIKKNIKLGDNYYDSKEAVKKGIAHKIFNYADKTVTKEVPTEEVKA